LRPENILSVGKKVIRPGSLACLGLLAAGCEMNDFIDPAEPGIVDTSQRPGVAPLKPILDQLDPREEPPMGFGQPTEIRPEDLIPEVADYRIGKNDLLSVSINDLMGDNTGETIRSERVSETGFITLPLLAPVKAEGYTENELEKQISEAYKTSNLIRNVRVQVTVTEARARTFSVMGNVGSPGEYQITRPDYRILDALIASHGPGSPLGVQYVYVVRNAMATPKAPAGLMPTTEPTVPAPLVPPTNPGDLLAPPHSQVVPTTPDATAARTLTSAPLLLDTAVPAMTTSSALTRPSLSPLMPESNEQPRGVLEGQQLPPGPAELPTTITPPPAAASGSFQFNATAAEQAVENQRVVRVPLRQLREQGELKYNIVIRPGDLIVVPDPVSGVFYLGGHVGRPGVYTVNGATPETLKQAVIGAGGYDPNAVPGRTELVRRIGPNAEIFVRIDLNKIYNGDLPDLYLKPNDTIWVGTDILAPFITALRTSFRISYGFGFMYDRNFYTGNNSGG